MSEIYTIDPANVKEWLQKFPFDYGIGFPLRPELSPLYNYLASIGVYLHKANVVFVAHEPKKLPLWALDWQFDLIKCCVNDYCPVMAIDALNLLELYIH